VKRQLVPAGETDHSSRQLIARLWRDWMRPHLRQILLAFAMMILVAATSGAYPLIIDQAISAMTDFETGAADESDRRLLLIIPVAVILVTLTKGLASYGQSVIIQNVAFKVISALQRAMFRHLLRADTLSFQATATGKLVARFTVDVFIMRDGMSKALTSLVRDLLTVAILIGAMFYLNWVLAAGVFIVFPLSAIPIVRIGRRLRKVSKSTQAEMGQLAHVMDENFSGIRLVKAYRLEEHAQSKADQVIESVRDLLMKAVYARGAGRDRGCGGVRHRQCDDPRRLRLPR